MKSLDFEAQSTLSYALSNGILGLDRVHELCMASKREQLGHASLSTTYRYIYNPLTVAESYKMLTEALSRKKDATPSRRPTVSYQRKNQTARLRQQ